jgi:hypothetical protein
MGLFTERSPLGEKGEGALGPRPSRPGLGLTFLGPAWPHPSRRPRGF